jgi:hypothetical protein
MTSPATNAEIEAIQQKARERTVKTQHVEYDLETLKNRIKTRQIRLDPEYQRRHRWAAGTSSRLIESLILNIPIPVIFLSQDVDVDEETDADVSRYTVIDGQQRLTAIYDFLNNELELEGLDTLTELNGLRYKQLPPFLVRRLEERTIKCLRIDSTVDDQVKFDIFERLNTGSVRLESQELRNATARGPFNDLIKDLAKNEDFMALLQIEAARSDENPKVKKMEDVELVLRFFALKDGRYQNLRKGFAEFLTAALSEFNERDEAFRAQAANDFARYMSFLRARGGDQAFSKWRYDPAPPKRMSTFNAAVFDAVAVGLAQVFSADDLENHPERVAAQLDGYRDALFGDRGFFAAVTGSVNDAAKVNERIDAMVSHLRR